MADGQHSNSGASAHPLAWPAGWPRGKSRARAAFSMTFAKARDELMRELAKMGARYALLSTNVALRRDGLPYANEREPDDPGVAVYFMWHGKQMTFACDRWDRVRDNVRAIGKTIEALRGIERWGASDMMERAFSAFEALPSPEQAVTLTCWQVLDLEPGASVAEIERAYRVKAKAAHPDMGGSRDEWEQLRAAYDQALKVAA